MMLARSKRRERYTAKPCLFSLTVSFCGAHLGGKSDSVSSLVLIFSTTYQNETEIEPREKKLVRS